MLKLRKVAVTGGLSCGKSSVCRILKELGAYIVSADEIVHQLLSSDKNLSQEVVKLLGTEIIINNQLDRFQIAQIVFQAPDLLQQLENILHPAVYEEIERKYQRRQRERPIPPLFAAEVPLLFESGGEKHFDYTVAVVANPKLSLQRFMQIPLNTSDDFEERSTRQLPLLEKAIRADYVIMNSLSLSDLQMITKELYQELMIDALSH